MLAEYYKEIGDKTKASDCSKMATEAWEPRKTACGFRPVRRGLPRLNRSAPSARTLRIPTRSWARHTAGSSSRTERTQHSLTTPAGETAPPPKDWGFYSVLNGQIRLWQSAPPFDRTTTFELSGDWGKNGAVLDGIKMRAVR